MGNMVISHSLRRFEVFLNVPVIIIIRFIENNVLERIYIILMEGEVNMDLLTFSVCYSKNRKITRA